MSEQPIMSTKPNSIDTSAERVRADGMRPEAIRLADTLPRAMPSLESTAWGERAAAELKRLHEVNQELLRILQDLEDIDFGADGWDAHSERVAYRARAAIAKAKGESNE